MVWKGRQKQQIQLPGPEGGHCRKQHAGDRYAMPPRTQVQLRWPDQVADGSRGAGPNLRDVSIADVYPHRVHRQEARGHHVRA